MIAIPFYSIGAQAEAQIWRQLAANLLSEIITSLCVSKEREVIRWLRVIKYFPAPIIYVHNRHLILIKQNAYTWICQTFNLVLFNVSKSIILKIPSKL